MAITASASILRKSRINNIMRTETKIGLGLVGCMLLLTLAVSVGMGVGAYFLIGAIWPDLPTLPHIAIAFLVWAVVSALGAARVTVRNK